MNFHYALSIEDEAGCEATTAASYADFRAVLDKATAAGLSAELAEELDAAAFGFAVAKADAYLDFAMNHPRAVRRLSA